MLQHSTISSHFCPRTVCGCGCVFRLGGYRRWFVINGGSTDDEGRVEDGVLEKLKTKQKKISQKKRMHQIQNNRVEIRPHIAWL